jgi:hypothetical protein
LKATVKPGELLKKRMKSGNSSHWPFKLEKEDIDNILASCTVKPMANQILAHISNTPKQLIKHNQDKDILVEAYSPFGHGIIQERGSGSNGRKIWGFCTPIRYSLLLAARLAFTTQNR